MKHTFLFIAAFASIFFASCGSKVGPTVTALKADSVAGFKILRIEELDKDTSYSVTILMNERDTIVYVNAWGSYDHKGEALKQLYVGSFTQGLDATFAFDGKSVGSIKYNISGKTLTVKVEIPKIIELSPNDPLVKELMSENGK